MPKTDTARHLYNPQMVVLGREALGLTQAELAGRLHCGQSRVSKIESGCFIPEQEELAQIAITLGLRLERLYTFSQDRSIGISFFRRTQSIPVPVVRKCEASLRLRWMDVAEARANSGVQGRPTGIPNIHVGGVEGAKGAARELRSRWQIPAGPVPRLIRRIQREGCAVEYFETSSEKLDAVAIGGGTAVPMMFLNRRFSPDRIRLSAAHELGHLVMHREPHANVEEEAWAFAAEFLMPAEIIKDELIKLNIIRLGELKRRWLVSMAAVLRRARDLESISERSYRFLVMRMSQFGWRRQEPYTESIPDETPASFDEWMEGIPDGLETLSGAGAPAVNES